MLLWLIPLVYLLPGVVMLLMTLADPFPRGEWLEMPWPERVGYGGLFVFCWPMILWDLE
jgi:hypothetical protein